VAVGESGSAYVTGLTSSADFPTQKPFQGTFGGDDSDAFLTKLSPSGNALSYSTYLGGAGEDFGIGVTVDGSENAYVAGYTESTDFPTENPYQGTYGGGDYDAFVTKFVTAGDALSYSTYLGGSGEDYGAGIALDESDGAYVVGFTQSTNFPTKTPFQGAYGGGDYDAFVAKLADTTLPTVTTQAVTDTGITTATGNGTVTDLGVPAPTQHGVCWKTGGTPTIADSRTEEGPLGATGPFTSGITGLSPNTAYHVRAYATNTAGTAYGGEVSFKTAYASTHYVSRDGDCGEKTPCYDAIQEAIDGAATGSLILVAQGTYTGSISLNASKSLTLQGGWDVSYELQTPNTTFLKAPKVTEGSLNFQVVTFRP
jgi:hypothetical protein